ncbi:MAG TPA: 4a-hydroxytetrahydrobiopterin dehydratase [Acidimicrobiales bacterium]|nr:4a-hydroxytetrahydrobiopterin dehydratase [Acidimicrobiales bacterium]
MERLSNAAVDSALADGLGWKLAPTGDRLVKTVERKDFAEAMKFVNAVADRAEARNHHPDIAIHWNRVDLELWTHTAGGVTQADLDLATELDALE